MAALLLSTIPAASGGWLLLSALGGVCLGAAATLLLVRRSRRGASPAEEDARLRALHEATIGLELGDAQQFSTLLRTAAEFLDQRIAIISRIDGDDYYVEHYYAPPGVLDEQRHFLLGKTYCSITYQADDVVAIEHMAASPHRRHPCYEAFALESYIGAPLRVAGVRRGTLNFSSPTPRARPWSDTDVRFVRLLSRWVSQTLERRQTLTALQTSEAHMRAIVDAAVDGIAAIDADGAIISYNAACRRLFGYEPEEALGRNVSMLMPQFHAERHDGYVRRYVETGERRVIGVGREVEGRRKDGSTFPAYLSVSEVVLPERRFFTGVIRDITLEKQTQRELEEYARRLTRSNRELQDFAFVASHDLQEPLRKVIAFGERLATSLGERLDEHSRDYLERMRNAAERMQTLIRGLLRLSRVTTQGQPFVLVDLERVAHDVLSDLEIQIERTGAQVTVGPLPSIDADPLQMRQLFQNLIGNALKFSRPDATPTVRVTGESTEGRCRIVVADSGIGFDAKYAERIFNVFQRLHGRGQYEGAGIGLALCKRIVERHSGRITADGDPGCGAAFVVELPARSAAGACGEQTREDAWRDGA